MSPADRRASTQQGRLGRMGALFAVGALLFLGGGAALAKKSKKGKAGSNVGEIASKVLLDQGDAVGDCAGKFGLDKGASRVSIDTQVTLDSKGTVVNIVTTVVVDKVAAEPIQRCVNTLIKTLKFPAIPAPLTTIARNWTVASN